MQTTYNFFARAATSVPPAEKQTYQEAVGSAIYLSLDHRVIQFAVKELARRMHEPAIADWQALKHLARFLKGGEYARCTVISESEKAQYRQGVPLRLFAFTDSDWAGCSVTRRSTDNVIPRHQYNSGIYQLSDSARTPCNQQL